MNEVRFNIHRNAALAGALLPCNLYINGHCIRTIHNGKTLSVSVPRADAYFIEDGILLCAKNAVLYDNGLPEQNIVIKRVGGWLNASYNVFCIGNGDALERLPSFHYEKVLDEKMLEKHEYASENERLLARCLEFCLLVMDDLQELFASDRLFEIMSALQKIGARQYYDLLSKIMEEDFADAYFPMSDEEIESMQRKIEKANRALWSDQSACAELHEAVALLITALNNPDYIF